MIDYITGIAIGFIAGLFLGAYGGLLIAKVENQAYTITRLEARQAEVCDE